MNAAALGSAFLAGAEQGESAAWLCLAAGAHPLVHVNAALNCLATALLCVGLWRIKNRREEAHGRTMLTALGVSTVFLACYLVYHALAGSVAFTHPGVVRYFYYSILISHVVLAFSVPLLALTAAFFGARALGWGPAAALPVELRLQSRARHIRIVRWAYPIWLYVSVTGVAVYAMLYHLWPSGEL